MNETDLRLECMRIALSAGATVAVLPKEAQRVYDWVTNVDAKQAGAQKGFAGGQLGQLGALAGGQIIG